MNLFLSRRGFSSLRLIPDFLMRSNKKLNVVDQVPDTGKFIKQVMYYFLLFALLFAPGRNFFQDSRTTCQLPGPITVSGIDIKHMKVVKQFPFCVSKFMKIVHVSHNALFLQRLNTALRKQIWAPSCYCYQNSTWKYLSQKSVKYKDAEAEMKIVISIRWEKKLSNGYCGFAAFKVPCHWSSQVSWFWLG